MSVEGPGRRELPELVADHVLRHEHGHELPTVVNREGETHRVRHDGRAAGTGLDDLFPAPRAWRLGFFHQVSLARPALLSATQAALSLSSAPPHDHPICG